MRKVGADLMGTSPNADMGAMSTNDDTQKENA